MARYFTITLFFTTLFFATCSKDGLVVSEMKTSVQDNEKFTLITNSAMAEELRKNRSHTMSEEFEIQDVSRTKKNGEYFLDIEITHHSCNPEIKIIWGGDIAESHPPQTSLYIQLLANDDCEKGTAPEKQKERISLSLNNLFADEYTAKHVIISIFNVSQKNRDNDNSDEPVHSSGNLYSFSIIKYDYSF